MSRGLHATLDLFQIAADLEALSAYGLGGLVCVERRKRPWRIQRVTEETQSVLTLDSGHAFDRVSGRPLFETKELWLRQLTRERLDYIFVVEAFKAVEKIKPNVLAPEEVKGLQPAAHIILQLAQRLRGEPTLRLGERSDDRNQVALKQ